MQLSAQARKDIPLKDSQVTNLMLNSSPSPRPSMYLSQPWVSLTLAPSPIYDQNAHHHPAKYAQCPWASWGQVSLQLPVLHSALQPRYLGMIMSFEVPTNGRPHPTWTPIFRIHCLQYPSSTTPLAAARISVYIYIYICRENKRKQVRITAHMCNTFGLEFLHTGPTSGRSYRLSGYLESWGSCLRSA